MPCSVTYDCAEMSMANREPRNDICEHLLATSRKPFLHSLVTTVSQHAAETKETQRRRFGSPSRKDSRHRKPVPTVLTGFKVKRLCWKCTLTI